MAFDPTKPVLTRDGRPARIICVDGRGDRPIVALIDAGPGGEIVSRYHFNGRHAQHSDLDLINIPERHVRWVNLYPHADYVGKRGYVYASKEEADKSADCARIACVRLEFEEGEGLSG